MDYKRFGETVIVRIDPDEEICEMLLALAKKENMMLAEISGIGAIKEFTAGVFDTVNKEYHSNSFQGFFEIVSLAGTITRKDGRPYLHVHMSAGDEEGNVFGGHLNRAVVSATAEIVVRIIDGNVGRHMSQEIGLNLLSY